jgi:transcriptional regulator with XRE-family HTH domain
MTHIADNIRKMRELRNFTQDYMATQLGITQAGYSKIESGTTDITFSKIEEIAQILNVTPTDLVAFDSQKYFNSFNNVEGSNNGSVIIDMKTDEVKRLYEDKIKLLEKLLGIAEADLQKYRDKFGSILN